MGYESGISDGLYRLVKLREDNNPAFPCTETIVEVRGNLVINLSTQREWALDALGAERALYGPLTNPFDGTPLERLARIDLGGGPVQAAGDDEPPDDVGAMN